MGEAKTHIGLVEAAKKNEARRIDFESQLEDAKKSFDDATKQFNGLSVGPAPNKERWEAVLAAASVTKSKAFRLRLMNNRRKALLRKAIDLINAVEAVKEKFAGSSRRRLPHHRRLVVLERLLEEIREANHRHELSK